MNQKEYLNLCDIVERFYNYNENKSNMKRLYIGSYFCGQYFIQLNTKMINNIITKDSNEEIHITLVVPMFSQSVLKKGKETIRILLEEFNQYIDEITVNDIGMLEYISTKYRNQYALFLGRMFVKDYRDPRYQEYYSHPFKSKMISSFYMELMEKYQIRGIEFDNTHMILDFSNVPDQLLICLHTPFCYYTMGQTCEFASIEKAVEYKFRPNATCNRECVNATIIYDVSPTECIRLGKAVYFKQEQVNTCSRKEDRRIYFPLEDLQNLEGEEEL